jgi:protein-S-isoprenylcysteine O-methyltransferase Ste14
MSARVLIGLTGLAWGAIELALRLRLMLRPGLRARLRTVSSSARVRLREWTFFLVVVSLVGAVALAGWLSRVSWAAMRGGLARIVVAEVLLVCGVALRVWAIVTLDRFFTFIVGIADDHKVVRVGPYRLIRHPGYAGALLGLLGIGVALGNWLSVLALLVIPIAALAVRIRVEEATLVSALGEQYRAYARQTSGLIPGVW